MTDETETQIQARCIQALTLYGYWVIRSGVAMKRGARGTQSGEPGQPDLCLPALGWLEVKRPGEHLSPDQLKWHAKAREHGVRVATVTSHDEAVAMARAWQSER